MKPDEYAVDETPEECAIARRNRPARMVPRRVKTETLERIQQAQQAIDRGLVPPRQPERQ